MKYAIKASDDAFKREPGDSLSSRYDDNGYSTWDIEQAVLYDNPQHALNSMHKEGKFSIKGGAVVVEVEIDYVFDEQKFNDWINEP